MSEVKHTPGEWFREGLTIYALDETGTNNRFSAHVQGGYKFRSRMSDGTGERTTDAELEANALLMGAAPDMLAALKLAHRWLANSVPAVDLDGPKPLPVIAAALSKAGSLS